MIEGMSAAGIAALGAVGICLTVAGAIVGFVAGHIRRPPTP